MPRHHITYLCWLAPGYFGKGCSVPEMLLTGDKQTLMWLRTEFQRLQNLGVKEGKKAPMQQTAGGHDINWLRIAGICATRQRVDTIHAYRSILPHAQKFISRSD